MTSADPRCLICSSETDDYLCFGCIRKLRVKLISAASRAHQLDITLSRQDRLIAAPDKVAGTGETALAYHSQAAEVAKSLHAVLEAWAHELAEKRGLALTAAPGHNADTSVSYARWLRHHVRLIALLPTADECYRQIDFAVYAATRCIDRPPIRLYIGPCGAAIEHGKCEVNLEVEMDDKGMHALTPWVRCYACGATTHVETRRLELRTRVRDMFGTAAELASLLPWILDSPVTRKRITYYATVGLVFPRKFNGETMYQIGEVIDAHVKVEARRAKAA